jgi:RNA polymerase sigma-70 factor (ECF subfamily)
MIYECIDFIRANKNQIINQNTEDNNLSQNESAYEMEEFTIDDIQYLIDNLPDGYKMVFNLFAIESYKHQEIAAMLKISEGTSKSQLSHARKLLQNQIVELKKKLNGTK